jgi:beta-phosphoglucomutase-like phosphatase (HAD superfamily)
MPLRARRMNYQHSTFLKKCKAIILDMDGVIVDSEPIHGESFRIFLDKLKVPYTEKFISDLVGYSINQNIQTINETYLQKRPMAIDEGVKIRDAIYLNLITNRLLRPMDGIEELILLSKKRGYKLGLASSSVYEQIDAILKNLSQNSENEINYETIFDIIVSGDDVQYKKPAPDIYKKVIKSLKIDKNDCIAIEDSGAGIISAKSSGVFCVALRNQYLKENEAQSADLVINSINDLVEMINSIQEQA